jgi:hypothetical protein
MATSRRVPGLGQDRTAATAAGRGAVMAKTAYAAMTVRHGLATLEMRAARSMPKLANAAVMRSSGGRSTSNRNSTIGVARTPVYADHAARRRAGRVAPEARRRMP